MTLPLHISSYGNIKHPEYCLRVQIGSMSVYYTFRSPIAYRTPDEGLVVSEHDFGSATDSHLDIIKATGSFTTLPRESFVEQLKKSFCKTILRLGQIIVTDRFGSTNCLPAEATEDMDYEHQQRADETDLQDGAPGEPQHRTLPSVQTG
jgi:hypothetical protein